MFKTVTVTFKIDLDLLSEQKKTLFNLLDTINNRTDRENLMGVLTMLDQISELTEIQPPPDGHQTNN